MYLPVLHRMHGASGVVEAMRVFTPGFLSPASRGALLTAMLVMYLLAALAAGYGSVALWGLMNRSYDGWSGVAWRCAAYFPGITLATLLALNVLLVHTGSSGAIPLGAFFSLIALWFLISIPLAFSGRPPSYCSTCRPGTNIALE